ncbi:putative cytosine-specific DNA methylase [Trypanosoma grayi]|uniref:putative cytosine-specific DNA methylase n=1 Tax=Trypanosoma grayi TaxID=71804 RepID=UPI0004F3FD90|nr:putative cytosine-specific DNA methylase [Trypanosoma grayi]KEG09401.1 putative cytosine-specific DNA methylase [Trypanosoma grayi]
MSATLDTALQELEEYRQTHPEAPRCVRDILEFRSDVAVMNEQQQQELVSLCLTEAQWESVQRSKTYRQSSAWRVADVDGLARTLMGSYRTSYQLYSEFLPVPDHAPPLRFYSIRECARLQGIPEWFSFNPAEPSSTRAGDKSSSGDANVQRGVVPVGAVYKLIGNAVNPIVVEHLGRALLACLPP